MARTTRNKPGNRAAGDPPSANEKRFVCTHTGCNKRFTRAEHVQRHALNHTAGQYTCLDCRAHFKRPDLLKRHMVRHRQKEQEAGGGPGNGILNTRKRSWKTLTGEVVEKRPHPPNELNRNREQENVPRAQDGASFESDSSASNIISLGLIPAQSDVDKNAAHNVSSDFDVSYPQESDVLPYDTTSCNFMEPSFYDFEHFEYDQNFQPDTASSFNMPYTTSLDYNWLFGDLNRASIQQPAETTLGATTRSSFISSPENHLNRNSSVQQVQYAATRKSPDSIESWIDPLAETAGSIIVGTNMSSSNEIPQYALNSTLHGGATLETPFENLGQESTRKQSELNVSTVRTPIRIIPPEIECPLSMLRKPPKFPLMNSETRNTLLGVIEMANPSITDQQCPVREHPLLSAGHLNSYLELYFTNFNTAYPLLHLASFDTCAVEPLLLISMLLLGATYSSKESHQLAVCIHDVIRPSIFAHAGFSPRPKLWILQAVLLIECFGKSRAGQQQHDMSHLFHGLLINLIRRSDCQSVQTQGPPGDNYDDEGDNMENIKQAWGKWSEAEEKKRLSLLCFMWDTQHAVLFCQSLCMSSFELRVTLPCSQEIWEAPDAISWAAAWRSSSSRDDRTSFLAALKSYLNQGLPRPAILSALSRVLLLHGLMAIAWDMQRREQTSLGVVLDPGSCDNWRKSLGTAYDTWKLDFDAHCEATASRNQKRNEYTHDDNGKADLTAFVTAYNAVYHAAKALLNMDFLDIQIYAGARHILGRPVQQKDYIRSSQIVKIWAVTAHQEPSHQRSPCHTKCALTASWHAARLLYEVSEFTTNSKLMGLFHVPWCIYLATLTCWAVHHATPGRNFGDDNYMDSDEIVWDPKGDMRVFISNMAKRDPQDTIQTSWQRGTTALAWVVADVLKRIRWGIIQAGVVVLQGLVPQRLIHQYEDQA
ncbi:fungal-specific transcription factor domain-containing protein [Xylaria sp. FL1777]|nr:fungal-specific transcription factor domain-containing protein [Xylaria sp. FL1777]